MIEFEQLIRDTGQEWIIDTIGSASDALEHLSDALAKGDLEYTRRFGGKPVMATPEKIAKAFPGNKRKTTAFLQAMGSTRNPEMLVMVWRILVGSSVAKIQLTYALETFFELVVTLVTPSGEPEEPYRSTDINDAVLLGHLGIAKMDGQPIFHGFYAMQI